MRPARAPRAISLFNKKAIVELAQAYHFWCQWVEAMNEYKIGKVQATPDQYRWAREGLAKNGQTIYERQKDLNVILLHDVRHLLNLYGVPADENCCAYGSKPSYRPPIHANGGRRAILCPERVQRIKALYYKDNWSATRIARMMECSVRTINKVITRQPPYHEMNGIGAVA